ncbi:DUF2127 domain-containing protein [Glutamicibacter halophytocola]|uniref:DUF2127 domain-containing protein n=2 Tax=Glutamicibacter halophytocola TaxID=1933880 RepID=UPI0026575E0C|nr:DUF2127 domain-containing protein [Glutamicibacter halophytocola]
MDTSGRSVQIRHRRLLDRTFYVGLILKGLNGLAELISGTALLFTGPAKIASWISVLTQHELSEDPQDFIARSLVNLSERLDVSATLFAAFYLLIHGLVKVVLVWAVLKNRLWAYPWLIGFLIAFILYQTYELIVNFSWVLLALTVFDVVIVLLTWREYQLHRLPGLQNQNE